jgi:hypothetical protein
MEIRKYSRYASSEDVAGIIACEIVHKGKSEGWCGSLEEFRQNPRSSKVSLVVSRFDGSQYQRLDSEPISLREIGYRDGELEFLSREGIVPVKGIRQMLVIFLLEIIKSYL